MKLTKDHLIEGQIIKAGTELKIKENYNDKLPLEIERAIIDWVISNKKYYSEEDYGFDADWMAIEAMEVDLKQKFPEFENYMNFEIGDLDHDAVQQAFYNEWEK